MLALLALVLPATEWRARRLKAPGLLFICAAISIALVYLVRYASHSSGQWVGTGLHYSTHTAFAVSLAVTLSLCRLALLPVMAVVVGAYLWLITFLGYHAPGDAISTAAVVVPLSLLCHLPWLLSSRRAT